MLPQAHLCHSAYGRTRLRIPGKRRDVAYFERVKEVLAKHRGWETLEVNPITGSVLLQQRRAPRGSAPAESVAEYGAKHKLFVVVPPKPHSNAPSFVERVTAGLKVVDHHLTDSTGRQLDLRSTAFLGLVGLGVLQLFRGHALAPASTLLSDAAKLLPRV